MASQILNPSDTPGINPSAGLFDLYQPEYAPHRFAASTKQEAIDWQTPTRALLGKTIGFSHLPFVDPSPKQIETVDKGDYTREKFVISVGPNSAMPFYMLKPKFAKKSLPVVLALHGHGYGVKDIVGLWEDGSERDVPDGYHRDFAVALCRRGFAVAAPEISCFGERKNDYSTLPEDAEEPSTCHHMATLAFHLGGSLVGLRVHEAQRLLDYLQTLPDLDMSRLGAMGISGGGMHTFFLTALDSRIRACVVSGYYSSFKDSILGMFHCTCNFVPGLHLFGEMHDIVGLIAPRPMFVESGSHDPIFPRRAVEEGVRAGNKVYGVFDKSTEIQTDYFEGRHRINGPKCYEFLSRELDLKAQ